MSLDCIEYVNTHDIIRCEASGNYTSIYLVGGKKLFLSKLLSEVEKLISNTRFFRSHKSHLVNLEQIVKFVKSEGGYIVMKDDEHIPLSRKKKAEFFNLMQNLLN